MVEMDQLPFYEVHTLYYQLYKEKEAESKLSEEEQQARAMGRMMEDNI